MTPSQQASNEFLREVQTVLQAFYHPSELQKSRLMAWLGLEDERDPAGALRRIFREAMRTLKPEEKAPRHSTAWRLHYVLTSRYIEQLSQKEVADELALSTRQVRRYERLAASLLANMLWKQFPTSAQLVPPPTLETVLPAVSPERQRELSWLKTSSPIETVSVAAVIASALKIAAPLIRNSGGNVQYEAPGCLPPATGQVSSIKQALLELLTAAISAAPGGNVSVTADALAHKILVRVRASGGQAVQGQTNAETLEKIEIARQLAQLSEGELEVQPTPGPGLTFDAALLLPALAQVAVLALDDNADALQLLQRFLAGTPYQLAVAETPEAAFELIEQSPPQIILLDVMLPGVDGWEVLGRLREHPQTQGVPVIVSTILLQEELALSLGAAGFLRKPFTQQALLAALDQQRGALSKESR